MPPKQPPPALPKTAAAAVAAGALRSAATAADWLEDGTPILVLLSWHEPTWSILSILLFAFVCVPILALASTIRQSFLGPLTGGETWVAYSVSLAALAAMIFFLPTEPGPVHPSAIGSAWIAAVGAIAVLASTMNSRVPRGVHAHVALLVAYVPSVGYFCMIVFGWLGPAGIGCWLAMIAIVAYIVEATLRVRAALRSEGRAGAEAR